MARTITATATRVGGWWAIEFISPVGRRYTQARRLDQVEEMVRDICSMDEVQVDAVQVDPVTSDAESRAVAMYLTASEEVITVAARASATSRETVSELRASGLGVRDVATLMGITPQCISQLARAS